MGHFFRYGFLALGLASVGATLWQARKLPALLAQLRQLQAALPAGGPAQPGLGPPAAGSNSPAPAIPTSPEQALSQVMALQKEGRKRLDFALDPEAASAAVESPPAAGDAPSVPADPRLFDARSRPSVVVKGRANVGGAQPKPGGGVLVDSSGNRFELVSRPEDTAGSGAAEESPSTEARWTAVAGRAKRLWSGSSLGKPSAGPAERPSLAQLKRRAVMGVVLALGGGALLIVGARRHLLRRPPPGT